MTDWTETIKLLFLRGYVSGGVFLAAAYASHERFGVNGGILTDFLSKSWNDFLQAAGREPAGFVVMVLLWPPMITLVCGGVFWGLSKLTQWAPGPASWMFFALGCVVCWTPVAIGDPLTKAILLLLPFAVRGGSEHFGFVNANLLIRIPQRPAL
jgi:hypothetical protein